MSETLTPQNPETPPVEQQLVIPFEVQATELVPVTPEDVRPKGELIAGTLDAARASLHGTVKWLAQRRMEGEGTTMERMDHKQAFYKYLGEKAIKGYGTVTERNGRQQRMETPHARTFAERSMEKSLIEHKEKHTDPSHRLDRENKIYKTEFSDLSRRGRVGKKFKHKIIDTQRNRAVTKQYKKGELTREELHIEKLRIKATPTPTESRYHKHLRGQAAWAGRSIKSMAEQPILNKWREHRRQNAIKGIKTNYYRSQNHAALKEEIAERQAERKKRQNEYTGPSRIKRAGQQVTKATKKVKGAVLAPVKSVRESAADLHIDDLKGQIFRLKTEVRFHEDGKDEANNPTGKNMKKKIERKKTKAYDLSRSLTYAEQQARERRSAHS